MYRLVWVIYVWLAIVFIWDQRISIRDNENSMAFIRNSDVRLLSDVEEMGKEKENQAGSFTNFIEFITPMDSVTWDQRGDDSETMARWRAEPDYSKKGCRLLKWSDFKGDTSVISNTVVAANTFTNWQMWEDIHGASVWFGFRCDFVDTASRARRPSIFGLMHERTHYYIRWIAAQRFRKKLADFQGTDTSRIKFVIDLFNWDGDRANAENSKFDNETANGCNTPAELMWEKKVRDELKKIN